MTLAEIVDKASDRLKEAGIEDARQDAFYLLDEVCGISRKDYLLHGSEEMASDQKEKYDAAISRRSHRMPCQYITGRAYFMGHTFAVNENVLIPRYDTEVLVEQAIEYIRSFCEKDYSITQDLPLDAKTVDCIAEMNCVPTQVISPDAKSCSSIAELDGSSCNVKVLDVCTGSGCIAISIKAACPEAEVSAIDISEPALVVATENARTLLVDTAARPGSHSYERTDCLIVGVPAARPNIYSHEIEICGVRFICSDLLNGLDAEESFDLIVSNPPYVTDSEYASLEPEITEHEPQLALTAGADGLDIYKKLIPQAAAHLKSGGALMLEIGSTQGEAVSTLMKQCGFTEIKVKNDLAGLPRVVTARK